MNIFIVLMVIYIVAMLILGYLGSKRATDSTSYATSNGDVSVFNVSITFAATFASAGTFLGVAGQGFAYGLTNFWFWASQWTSAGIIMAIIVRRYRRMNSMKQSATVADWIADRYHSQGLRVWLAIVSLAQVAFIASQLVGAGIIINQMIPSISYKMGVLISAIVIIIYICMGGSYAHIYTNIAQGLMMTVLGVILAVSGIFIFGNVITEVPARLAEIDPNLAMGLNPNNAGYPTPIYVVGLFVAHLWWALNPQLINKATYLKNDKDVKTFCWLAPLLMFLMCSVVFVGSYTRVLVPEGIGDVITGMDGAVPYYVSLVFPKFIAAVFLVVIMAAMMSTVDGVLLYVSSMLMDGAYVNDAAIIAQNNKMISINSCVEIDFYGQAASESVGKLQISGTGGQTDFVRGATRSPGGKSLIVLQSTAQGGKKSKIVPFLGEGTPVTLPRTDIDYVVTEYGVAALRGKCIRERAQTLIHIAHPNFREELIEAWEKFFCQKFPREVLN